LGLQPKLTGAVAEPKLTLRARPELFFGEKPNEYNRLVVLLRLTPGASELEAHDVPLLVRLRK